MPVNSSLSQIDDLVAQFTREMEGLSKRVQKDFLKLIERGNVGPDEITALFEGYDMQARKWVNTYSKVVGFNKKIADELGLKLKLSEVGESMYLRLREISFQEMNVTRLTIQNSLARVAVRSEIEGIGRGQIIKELDDIFGGFERRIETEAFTGMINVNNAVKLDAFQNVGVEKYVYVGPRDDKTRDVCMSTLSDPRQETGWTLTEINNSETPFISRGGWNCRHEWIPYING